MGKNIFRNIITFLAIFLVVQMLFSKFFSPPAAQPTGEITIKADKTEYGRGAQVIVKIENKSLANIVIPSECPGEPLDVFVYKDNQWAKKEAKTAAPCIDANAKPLEIATNATVTVNYAEWNHALFDENGRYKISFKTTVDNKEKIIESSDFAVVDPSLFRVLWLRGFYQPIYNILMYIIAKMPGHDLGFAIIALTILIRLILLIPSQKALRSQKKMQVLQPKLAAIKEQYAGDQQRIGQETMKLWKDNKVNPFGSCLPLLMQFPVLIALFYVIQSGLNPDNIYLLYNGFVSVSFTEIHNIFLGVLDLTKRNIYVLPLIVGLLQFLQMYMTVAKKTPGEKGGKTAGDEMQTVNKTMTYVMPVMIAFFTASVPAGVGLYWGTSTAFGIAQQWIVNREFKPNPTPPAKEIINV